MSRMLQFVLLYFQRFPPAHGDSTRQERDMERNIFAPVVGLLKPNQSLMWQRRGLRAIKVPKERARRWTARP